MSGSVSVTSSDTDNIDSILVSATGRRGLSSIVMAVMVSGCSTLERDHSARPSGKTRFGFPRPNAVTRPSPRGRTEPDHLARSIVTPAAGAATGAVSSGLAAYHRTPRVAGSRFVRQRHVPTPTDAILLPASDHRQRSPHVLNAANLISYLGNHRQVAPGDCRVRSRFKQRGGSS